MVNRSGPWFDVIESATEQQQNEKPLRKSAATELTDKLNGEVTDASSGV